VHAHFEHTEKVLTDLQAAHQEGLLELEIVKGKLAEENMPAIRI
jgi:hypothetical protein